MTEHCMIDGERCSKCCEVLTISENKLIRAWLQYARRVDFKDFEPDDNSPKKEYQTYWMIKKISKRKAKLINPHLVSIVKNNQSYFTCKHLTDKGCGNYENRPSICSGYPYYGKSKEEFIKTNIQTLPENDKGKSGLYTDGCTYYIELK